MLYFLMLFSLAILIGSIILYFAIDKIQKEQKKVQKEKQELSEQNRIERTAKEVLKYLYVRKYSQRTIPKITIMEEIGISVRDMTQVCHYLERRNLASISDESISILEFGIEVVENFEL